MFDEMPQWGFPFQFFFIIHRSFNRMGQLGLLIFRYIHFGLSYLFDFDMQTHRDTNCLTKCFVNWVFSKFCLLLLQVY